MPSSVTTVDRSLPRAHSFERLADVYHQFLSEQSLSALLERIADTLSELVPYDSLTIYEADEAKRRLTPVLARDAFEEAVMDASLRFGEGITGWAVENRIAELANRAHLHPRVSFVPNTPVEPEALITIPLIARDHVKGALNIYRLGESFFDDQEFALAKRFADAAALAIDNAHIRHSLEHQAQTDHLTGLYNHRFFHERLRSEITRASRAHDTVALLMFDIDDFKKINDVHGHAVGDQILCSLADVLRATVRGSDVACRIGGEEFAVVLPSCDAGDAAGLARRIRDRLSVLDLEPAGQVTVSIGIAQGPDHAMNVRQLVACAEAAMMTAKTRGKNQAVLYDVDTNERPSESTRDDVRSMAHLKMLQSLAGKLNRLNDVRQIAETIADELRTLIDYHSCRIHLAEGTELIPVAVRGQFEGGGSLGPAALATSFGQGVTGTAAAMARSLLIPNALECEYAVHLPGTTDVEETLAAVPMMYGARVNGTITISKLGVGQLDDADVRLLELLAAHASVALENARLYEAQRREATNARSLLELGDQIFATINAPEIGNIAVKGAAELLGVDQAAMWLLDESADAFTCFAQFGYSSDEVAKAFIRRAISKEEAGSLLEGMKEPFVLEPDEMLRRFPELPAEGLRPVMIAPLVGDMKGRGWIVARRPVTEAFAFSDDKQRLFAGFAYQVSVALEKAHLYRSQKETADIASALLRLSAELSSAETLDAILEGIVERSASILGSPQTWVWLQDPDTGDLLPEAWWGIGQAERQKAAQLRLPAEAAEQLFGQATVPFAVHPEDYARLIKGDAEHAELMHAFAPIRLDGRLGCIVIAAPALGEYTFSERKMRLLAGIADQAKLALNNANNFETLETTFLSTIEALANALEAKDEYTSSHTRSIVDMSMEVGQAMGLPAKSLKNLEMGALFHDIGKIGIPSDIIRKPGPLTDEERRIMNMHPELGERILAPIDRLAGVRPIVRACHEHFDGSGYPDRKVGDQIPIEARIILVCDAFDAMTTDRPYRDRLSTDEAIRRLKESSGRQFDPEVVDAFLGLIDEQPDFAGPNNRR